MSCLIMIRYQIFSLVRTVRYMRVMHVCYFGHLQTCHDSPCLINDVAAEFFARHLVN